MKTNIAKSLLRASAVAALAIAAMPASAQTTTEFKDAPKAAPTTVQHPDWSRNAVIYEVNWRQMTDDSSIKGVEEQLPRLKDLGVDILWIMPVNPISELGRKGELGSYYASANYKGINPEMGTFEDFRHFVKAAHDMGFKVIIDWVPNHTGNDNWWRTYHPDFYVYNEDGSVVHPADWTDVSQLNYSNPEMRKYMIDAMRFWLFDAGIDGFRCDVAEMVPVDFWDEARRELQAVKPDLFMLAEASAPALQKNAFDMAYNWPMAVLFKEIANNADQFTFSEDRNFPKRQAVAIDSLLLDQQANFPADTYMMNMITNHDFNSWEGTEFKRFGNLANAMAVLSYTLPGMPLIYTGQETGMDRAFEFFKKDVPPTFEPRNDYFTFYQKLNDLKHNEAALLAGNAGGDMVRYPTKSDDLYVFSRTKGDSQVLVLVNLGAKEQKLQFKGSAPSVDGMKNYFTGKAEKLPKKLAAGQFLVFVRQ